MIPYDTEMSDEEADDIERERFERRHPPKKYMFTWCERCTLLKGCYYQHGERSNNPHFLTEECGNGPAQC